MNQVRVRTMAVAITAAWAARTPQHSITIRQLPWTTGRASSLRRPAISLAIRLGLILRGLYLGQSQVEHELGVCEREFVLHVPGTTKMGMVVRSTC